MIIPYGHDQAIRRIPWASIAILAINVAMFLLTRVTFGGENEATLAAREERLETLEATLYRRYIDAVHDRNSKSGADEQPLAWDRFLKALDRGPVDGVEPEQLERWRTARDQLERSRGWNPDKQLNLVMGPGFKPWTLVTHMFMHVNWLHLLGNMWFFALAAPSLEYRWGVPAFLVLYLGGGLAAAASMYPALRGTEEGLLGASGAVAACMGAFFVRHWNAKVKFFWLRGLGMTSLRWGELWMPAWLMIGLWLIEQAMYASAQEDLHVAVWAHIGGFGYGAAMALAVRQLRWEAKLFDRRILLGGRPDPDDKDTDMALELIEKCAWRDASKYCDAALAKHPGHTVLLAVKARALGHLGDLDEARAALAKAIVSARATGPTEHLLDAAKALGERVTTLGIDPALQQLLGRWLEDNGEPEDALWVYRDLAESHVTHGLAPKALYRVADLHRTARGDLQSATNAFNTFLERYPDHALAANARAALESLSRATPVR